MGSVVRVLNAGAEHTRAQANVDASRIRQKASNERKGAESSLAAFSQALGNSRILDAAGDEVNSISENISRNLDAAASGTLWSRVAASEELGASIASAAAAGVGGSSIEAYNATLRRASAIQEESNDRALQSDLYLATKSKGDTLKNAVGSFGNQTFSADLDYTQYVDHKKLGGFAQFATIAAAAAATYFGGPQAGMAVTDAVMAQVDANNGDMSGAMQGYSSAVKNGVSGFDAYRRNAAPGKSGEAWGKGVWESSRKIMSNVNLK